MALARQSESNTVMVRSNGSPAQVLKVYHPFLDVAVANDVGRVKAEDVSAADRATLRHRHDVRRCDGIAPDAHLRHVAAKDLQGVFVGMTPSNEGLLETNARERKRRAAEYKTNLYFLPLSFYF